ncbi:hypothetical protein FKW77_003458 [Venturia effusa]|uniref:Killer toxin Kp4 domain-containing protein n=1 Tax=Venturia effusa TaxID=50376 RepID=A0A517L2Y3_9PEZI|nr:hypothetical protein FKW77_003458 [Venturia effusa]
MRFIPYLAALLLTLAPSALAKKRGCVHFMVSYQVPCDKKAKRCEAGDYSITKEAYLDFMTAQETFLAWVRSPAIGGTCGGYCSLVRRAHKKSYKGMTYFMDCFGARVTADKQAYLLLGAPPANIELAFMDTKCNVWCDVKSQRTGCTPNYASCK